jgi:large subunit ribosomal protein L18
MDSDSMADGPTFKVKFRRRREGRTDYSARLSLLRSKKPRLIVRRGANNVIVQIAGFDFKGDKIVASADSVELRKLGWHGHGGNLSSAYLAGLLCAKKALAHGIKEVIVDLGLHRSIGGSALYSAIKGAIDAGMKIPHDAEMLPSNERVSGHHIAEYAKKLKGGKDYDRQFSHYIKKGFDPQKFPENFEAMKKKIKA